MDLTQEFDDFLDSVSLAVVRKIHGRELAPNAPSTIAKKGFDFPLVETTALLSDIHAWREGKQGHVGVKSENAYKLEIAEFGLNPPAPARPVLRLTVDEDLDPLLDIFGDKIQTKIENYLR